MVFKAMRLKKYIVILWNKSNKGNMPKSKRVKNQDSIKQKGEITLMMKLNCISFVPVLVHIRQKCNGLKKKNLKEMLLIKWHILTKLLSIIKGTKYLHLAAIILLKRSNSLISKGKFLHRKKLKRVIKWHLLMLFNFSPLKFLV